MNTSPDLNKSSFPHYPNEWDIDLQLPLGKGALSVGVFKAFKKNGIINNKSIQNGLCAIKIINEDQIASTEKYEVPALNRLMEKKFENIVEIYGYGYGYHDGKRALFIYMKYIDGYKSIGDLIKSKFPFSEAQISKIINDLVYALVSLHENQILHRDIKGDNILYNIETGHIVLIDFGISKCFDKTSNYGTLVGTKTHMAPEVVAQNYKASSRSDIWSVGCTVIEMAGGDLSKDKNGKPNIPSSLSNECKNFIQHCLVQDSYGRLKANELIHHDFLNKDGIQLSESNRLLKNKYKININHISITKDQIQSIKNNTTINSIEIIDFNEDIANLKQLPENITRLSLPIFDQTIQPNSIASHIQSLSILSFNQDIDENAFPPNVTELEFGSPFEFNEYAGNLSDEIKKLKCSYKFKEPLKRSNNIPKNVSTLILDNYDHQFKSNFLPSTVQTLQLGSNYQHLDTLVNLPSSVFNLILVSSDLDIESKIKPFLPPSITKLIINRP